jgi:hypothetical protein
MKVVDSHYLPTLLRISQYPLAVPMGCDAVKIYRRFGGIYSFHLQPRRITQTKQDAQHQRR